MSFWKSKFVKDLENGKLPEIPVSVENSSIIYLSVALLIVGLILILVTQIFKAQSK
jgi:hypothetical protein